MRDNNEPVICTSCKTAIHYCDFCTKELNVSNVNKAHIAWEFISTGSISRKSHFLVLCGQCTNLFIKEYQNRIMTPKKKVVLKIKDKKRLR